MGVGPEGRGGLAELLANDGTSPSSVTGRTGGGVSVSGHEDEVAAARENMGEGSTRSARQALRFALGLDNMGGEESSGSTMEGLVTPRFAAAFRAKVDEEVSASMHKAKSGLTDDLGDMSRKFTPPKGSPCTVDPDPAQKENDQSKSDATPQNNDPESTEPTTTVPIRERLGPEICTMDTASVSGNLKFSKKSEKSLELCVESHSNFSSCRGAVCVIKGKWQYEVTLETAGIQQLGWATYVCPFTNEEGVGDAQDSYAYDGKRIRKWNVNCEQYGQPWACGDVIGCCIDLDNRTISFYRNGIDLGIAFRNIRTASFCDKSRSSLLAYFPALSLSHGERCELNFGSRPFQHPVEDYKPLQMPPPEVLLHRARFLTSCLGRLVCEIDVPHSKKVSKRLSKDDACVAAGLVLETLAPLLSDPYISEQEVLPLMYSLNASSVHSSSDSECLKLLMEFIKSCTEDSEFSSFVENTFATLSLLGRTSFFGKDTLSVTGSYPHLELACSLMKVKPVMESLVSSPHFDSIIEGLMTKKQPNSYDLSNVMPTVWWLGAQDEICSEERMKSSCSSLSISFSQIEDKQREICQVMLQYRDAESVKPKSNYFLSFVRRLLTKNRWAVRNVQPPGLSDNTVLVSIYFIVLDMLKASLLPIPEEYRPSGYPPSSTKPSSFPSSTFL